MTSQVVPHYLSFPQLFVLGNTWIEYLPCLLLILFPLALYHPLRLVLSLDLANSPCLLGVHFTLDLFYRLWVRISRLASLLSLSYTHTHPRTHGRMPGVFLFSSFRGVFFLIFPPFP